MTNSRDLANLGGGFIQAGGGVQRTVESKLKDVVSVKDFGAVGDGVTDDTAAIQATVDAVVAAGGGTVYIPSGAYLLNGTTGDDGIVHGILVPFQSSNGLANRVHIVGQSKSTELNAGSDNMYIIRWSDSHGKLSNLSLDNNGHTGVTALAVVPEDTTQTTTVVYQQQNTFEDIIIRGTTEGITLRTGPNVGSVDSGCWYNKFNRIRIYQCTRGIWLRPCPVGSSANNRNEFSNITIGSSTNTGIQIDDGDTNTFVQVSFEGISSGTSPNSTPTAIIIDQTSTAGGDNNSNRFIGCTMESVTRAVDNSNANTEFISCNLGGTFTSVFTALPRVMLGGGDASSHPVITPAFTYQSNSQISGVPNLALYPSNNIILKDDKDIRDESYPWQSYAITTSNTDNVTSISEYRSEYKSVGQFVTWVCRLQFRATSTGGIKIELPVDPNNDLYRQFTNISPYEIPINVHNGSGVVAGRLVICRHNQDLNGNAYVTALPFSGNFNTGGNVNTVWFTLTYHR